MSCMAGHTTVQRDIVTEDIHCYSVKFWVFSPYHDITISQCLLLVFGPNRIFGTGLLITIHYQTSACQPTWAGKLRILRADVAAFTAEFTATTAIFVSLLICYSYNYYMNFYISKTYRFLQKQQ